MINLKLSTLSFKKLLSFFAFLFLVSCNVSSSSDFAPKALAPKLEIEDLEGNVFSLDKRLGKVNLVVFWASWCLPCKEELPELEILKANLKNEDFKIILVAVDDSKEAIIKFIEKSSLRDAVVLDPKAKSRSKFKLSGYPESFFLDAKGRYMMLKDPEDGRDKIKILGPRKWSSVYFMQTIGAWLSDSSNT